MAKFIHHKNDRLNWKTPRGAYQILDAFFNFNFDPCPANPKFDGLEIEWKERNFVNPPYGNQIYKWIKKGYEECKKGKLVVFLIPSRTDTKWWHEIILRAKREGIAEIKSIKGRLHFDEYEHPAPFPSCLVIMSKELKKGFFRRLIK